MKIYGYENSDESDLIEMSEVTICASPENLREIALFINKMADEMEESKDSFDHAHLRDNWPEWNEDGADIIVGPSAT